MRALLCEELGPPEKLVLKETDRPVASKGQILIRVAACSLNFPDTLIIEGLYQFRPPMPFSPGAEVSGVVEETGEGVTGFQKGDRVVAGITWGGLADYAVAEAMFTFHLPDGVDDEIGAAMLMTYGTSLHALIDRAMLKYSDTLLVLGASGGVGTAAIQIGKALGAKVIAAASSEEKLVWCQEQGADILLNYEEETDLKNKLKELTDGKGVDVIYDPVGGKFSEPAFRAIARGGRHLVVGFTNGDIPKIPFNLPLLKSASVVGVFWGSFIRNESENNIRNVKLLFKLIEKRKITPRVSKVYKLEEAVQALNDMKNRSVLGKIVVRIS
ncbi:MAG: NADPH:quinone oxidoreductase family protein [Cyclobacteriaceae bacterium]